MKRTSIFLDVNDKKAITTIKVRYGLSTDSDAIRLSLRVVAESPHLIVSQVKGDSHDKE